MVNACCWRRTLRSLNLSPPHTLSIRLSLVTSPWSEATDGFRVSAPGLEVAGTLGGAAPFDWLLRWVPARLATAPAWLRAIDPIAARLVPGVRTAGTAGQGRREYYGVQRARRIASADGNFRGVDLSGLATLDPPVRFGFSSAPATPQLVSVTTTIDVH